jgi:hypothetical protein
MISEYVMGDISSTIYPVNGGLEDWAYGAGWDFGKPDATLLKCTPQTYQLPDSIKFGKDAYSQVRAAIYIVETDDLKRPPENFLGRRLVSKSSSRLRIKPDSVMQANNEFDGHINRNIRLTLSLIDSSKPSI